MPIVAFDRPASKEILGDLAFYATLGDPLALAEALYEVLTNTERAQTVGLLGRTMAVERYSWLAVGRRLTDAYADVIGKNKRH